MKTKYQQAKEELKSFSKSLKKQFGTDKPAVRMHLNDTCDAICRDYQLSDYQTDLLHNYTCTLHPK